MLCSYFHITIKDRFLVTDTYTFYYHSFTFLFKFYFKQNFNEEIIEFLLRKVSEKCITVGTIALTYIFFKSIKQN